MGGFQKDFFLWYGKKSFVRKVGQVKTQQKRILFWSEGSLTLVKSGQL